MGPISPSSSSSPPPPQKLAAPPPAPAPSTSSLPTSWSHIETIHLIDAYRDKWYSLNRGQLRANQWEEVARSVAARCEFASPTKTATQCRHKIEKLRKRYRAEKQRRPSAPAWPYFHRIDLMEKGPRTARGSSSDDDGDDEDNEINTSNTRSINHILQRPPLIDNSFPRFSRNPRFRKRSFYDDREEDDKEVEEEDRRREPVSELAAVIRSFGEGFVRMEKMKMEMMRETERNRMEMERRRTEMILDSQMRMTEALKTAIYSVKKSRKSEKAEEI
ncbi:trihelix transcription factor ENAP1-like [Aristolochia californica]|uniref:trihelix transcription factor ENAP1-like n=1 Tax=Aristolochia californica TaxID=171875 RepID=UPI0035DADFBE